MLIPFLNVSQRLGFVNIPSGNLRQFANWKPWPVASSMIYRKASDDPKRSGIICQDRVDPMKHPLKFKKKNSTEIQGNTVMRSHSSRGCKFEFKACIRKSTRFSYIPAILIPMTEIHHFFNASAVFPQRPGAPADRSSCPSPWVLRGNVLWISWW